MPQICRYWQQGICKFGDTCRFNHPSTGSSHQSSSAKPTSHSNSQSGTTIGLHRSLVPTDRIEYVYDKQAIIHDLTAEKPKWVLSAYGPGRQAPAQLFGGFPREQSFEEIRWLHYMASSDPQQLQQTVSNTNKLIEDSEKQIQHVIQNIDAAVQFLSEARKQHPNRVDICRASELGHNSNIQTPNDKPLTINTPAFGVQKLSAPVFGAPTAIPGAFQQPSTIDQRANPFACVKPILGSGTNQVGIFGRPADNIPNTTSTSQGLNPFEKASVKSPTFQSPKTGLFGKQNPFAAATTVPFGTPSPRVLTQDNISATTEVSQTSSPFKQGQVNSFGLNSNLSFTNTTPASKLGNPFANSNNVLTSQSNGLPTQSNRFAPLQQTSFGNPSLPNTPNAFTASSKSTPNFSNEVPNTPSNVVTATSSSSNSKKTLISFNDKPVKYKDKIPGYINNDGLWERIWFPDGIPVFSKDAKLSAETVYEQKTVQAYAYARKHKRFEDGMIPTLPPKEEWCSFEF